MHIAAESQCVHQFSFAHKGKPSEQTRQELFFDVTSRTNLIQSTYSKLHLQGQDFIRKIQDGVVTRLKVEDPVMVVVGDGCYDDYSDVRG
jgi:hypothetical protein